MNARPILEPSRAVALPHPVLRAIMRAFHQAVARTPTIGKPYLDTIGAILRGTPDFPLKAQLINNICSAEWPDLGLGSRHVDVCPGSTIRLVPHAGEFDFMALLARQLGYESAVFRTLAERFGRYDGVIEIGANVGVYSVFFAAQAAAHRRTVPIYSFEPSRAAYLRLLENLRVNGAAAVTPFNLAVTDRAGFAPFFEPRGHLTNGSVSHEFASIFADDVVSTVVPTAGCAQIESLVDRHTSLLLKIDVEGAEALLLAGLRPLIERKRPEIVLEVLSRQDGALNDLGFIREVYDLFLITDGELAARSLFQADAQNRDYLLIPKGRSES